MTGANVELIYVMLVAAAIVAANAAFVVWAVWRESRVARNRPQMPADDFLSIVRHNFPEYAEDGYSDDLTRMEDFRQWLTHAETDRQKSTSSLPRGSRVTRS